MTLDLRGISFTDSFKLIRDAAALSCFLKEDIVAFIEAYENDKCTLLKGLAELVLDCKTILEESNGFYIIKIMPS
jgi:hypothetical protein